jgi:CheY-like chemotaxis protein
VDKLKPKHTILVAEDNEDDYLLMRDAIEENELHAELEWVKDGVELMARLQAAPYPELIILDLKMPRKNGIEALQEIKADPKLKLIPIIVFSTSNAETDIKTCYELGANSYIQKPVGFVLFAETMQTIYDYWFGFTKRVPLR